MAKYTRTRADGWVQVSLGETQFQLGDVGGLLEFEHGSEPTVGDEGEFIVRGLGLEFSLVPTTCWARVLGGGTLTFSAIDISA